MAPYDREPAIARQVGEVVPFAFGDLNLKAVKKLDGAGFLAVG